MTARPGGCAFGDSRQFLSSGQSREHPWARNGSWRRGPAWQWRLDCKAGIHRCSPGSLAQAPSAPGICSPQPRFLSCWTNLRSVATGSGAPWDVATGRLPRCLFLGAALVPSIVRQALPSMWPPGTPQGSPGLFCEGPMVHDQERSIFLKRKICVQEGRQRGWTLTMSTCGLPRTVYVSLSGHGSGDGL